MKIFKKTENIHDKKSTLLSLIQSYYESKKELNKIKTQHSTYWWGGASILVGTTFLPLFFFPLLILPLYATGIIFRLKYNKWVKAIKKLHQSNIEDFNYFLQNNEKEIIKEMYKDIKSQDLEAIFEDIIIKCANNEYTEELIYHVDNFYYRVSEIKRQEIRLDKAQALKKVYQLHMPETYSPEDKLKEKYSEMC